MQSPWQRIQQVYTTKAKCLQAIELRKKANKKDRTDFEDFYIAAHTRYPNEGVLTTKYYVKGSLQQIYACPRTKFRN